ncbi:MAG: glucose-6-phosphate isomerase [Pseudomonadota bacterium]
MTDALDHHARRLADARLTDLASARAGAPPLDAAGWRVDMARQRLDEPAEAALLDAARAVDLEGARDALFAGDIVNPSENRAALHWALRAQSALEGAPEAVRQSLAAADGFAQAVRSGAAAGAGGRPFRAIVHLGIGGSDLGPRLLADALHMERDRRFELRFAANLDPLDIELALDGLNPTETLVIGVSKSFGTEETLYNLTRTRAWLETSLGADWTSHVALVTANPARAETWIGGPGRIFDMPETIGGRFSVWSAGSLACTMAFGLEAIQALRAGAAEMDAHVQAAPIHTNAAMRLALLDYWNRSYLGASMRIVLAYARRLRLLPAYLQQLETESNGKSVRPDGSPAPRATAPAIWGGEGTVGQHSYHQWLHQGTDAHPTEFVLALDENAETEGQSALVAHALAQAEVLANGRSLSDVHAEEPDLDEAIARQKVHAGGRPSTFLTHTDFSPRALGALIALYEHRTYFAGRLWRVNAFDQWGVERGKTIASRLKPAVQASGGAEDPVTATLLQRLRR